MNDIRTQPWFKWAIVTVIGISTFWILLFAVRHCGGGVHEPRVVVTPAEKRAAEIQERVRQDERFRWVEVLPAPDQPNTMIFAGEVPLPEDIDALKEWISKQNFDFEHRVEVEPHEPDEPVE